MYKGNNIDGWMNDNELDWLYEKARQMDSIVEIGSWKGKSTHALLTGCRGVVFAIDHFQGSVDERDTTHKEAKNHDIYKNFYKNVGHFKNLVTMRTDSKKASSFFKAKSIDMVFIDGDHTFEGVFNDIKS